MLKTEIEKILIDHGCPHEKCVAVALSAILALFEKMLPEKETMPTGDFTTKNRLEARWVQGFNSCIDEMKRRFE